MRIDLDNPWIWLAALAVAFLMGLCFYAACALANREFRFWPAEAIGALTFAASGLLVYLVVPKLVSRFVDPAQAQESTGILVFVGIAWVVSWLVSIVAYSALFTGRVDKALQVASIELGCRLLIAALIGGIIWVVLAVRQFAQDPQQREVLVWFSVIFGGILLLIFGLFAALYYSRRSAAR